MSLNHWKTHQQLSLSNTHLAMLLPGNQGSLLYLEESILSSCKCLWFTWLDTYHVQIGWPSLTVCDQLIKKAYMVVLTGLEQLILISLQFAVIVSRVVFSPRLERKASNSAYINIIKQTKSMQHKTRASKRSCWKGTPSVQINENLYLDLLKKPRTNKPKKALKKGQQKIHKQKHVYQDQQGCPCSSLHPATRPWPWHARNTEITKKTTLIGLDTFNAA